MRITAENIEQILRRLEGKPLYAEPWQKALEKATLFVKRRAERLAPRDTGMLAASITWRLDTAPVPRYGVVSTNRTNRGFRFPFALNASEKFHYRRGRYQGRPTRRWFTRALTGARKKVQGLLVQAVREIEGRWRTS